MFYADCFAFICSKLYYLRRTKLLLLLILLIPVANIAFGQKKGNKKIRVQIVNSNTFEFDKSRGEKVKRLIGDVQFKQDDILLFCDSAYFYDEENLVEAYSRVRITRSDGFVLSGDFLRYEGDIKRARMIGNVHMTDPSMELTTTEMDFDLDNNIGYYTNGATILNNQNKLTSRFGYFYTKTNQVYFKKDVLLVNPEYTIDCDTLLYNTVSKTAWFLGPTNIKSDDNTIYCENGWYDTQRELSQFSRNAVLTSKENIVMADSLTYNRKTGLGRGFRNLRVIDTAEKLTIRGNYGEINRLKKTTYITQKPVAKKLMGNDSIYLLADTLFYLQGIDSNRILKAFYNSRILKKDLQAVSDSIVYSLRDSVITLFNQPVMWSEEKQITADTIRLFIHKNQLDSMLMQGNAFIATKENDKHFNQIKGRNMKGLFNNQQLQRVIVIGNGESIYYAKDSSGYIGMNRISCSHMLIRLDSNQLQKITFYEKPAGTIFPVNNLPEPETRIKGFKWLWHRRPKQVMKELF